MKSTQFNQKYDTGHSNDSPEGINTFQIRAGFMIIAKSGFPQQLCLVKEASKEARTHSQQRGTLDVVKTEQNKNTHSLNLWNNQIEIVRQCRWSRMMQELETSWAERLRVQWCRHHRVGRLPKIVTSFSTLAQVASPYWKTSWYLSVWSISVDLSICDLWISGTHSRFFWPLFWCHLSRSIRFSHLYFFPCCF